MINNQFPRELGIVPTIPVDKRRLIILSQIEQRMEEVEEFGDDVIDTSLILFSLVQEQNFRLDLGGTINFKRLRKFSPARGVIFCLHTF